MHLATPVKYAWHLTGQADQASQIATILQAQHGFIRLNSAEQTPQGGDSIGQAQTIFCVANFFQLIEI